MLTAFLTGPAAHSETPVALLEGYREMAAVESAAYTGPSARRGNDFFHARGKEWSCASCHTADPRQAGRHTVTGKPIRALAPAANPERFSSRDKAEKWFKRNCNDTLGRECTSAEKADLIAYLLSLGSPSTQ
jgi:hypothetical protein